MDQDGEVTMHSLWEIIGSRMAVLLAVVPVNAAADGKSLAEQRCASCHGPQGHGSLAQFPILVGQREPYLLSALAAYRDGRRGDPEMRQLAAYFSGQTGLIARTDARSCGSSGDSCR